MIDVLTIGGSLNTSVGGIDDIVSARNEDALLKVAGYQVQCGADILSVNAGTRVTTEVEDVLWMAGTIQSQLDVPLCFDSSNPEVFSRGLAGHKSDRGRPVIDSVSGSKESLLSILPLAAEYGVPVIGLLMDEDGISETPEGRIDVARKIVSAARDAGIQDEDLFLDPIVQPVSVQSRGAVVYLDTLKLLKEQFPAVRISCGLDNISYGLPAPELLNILFLAMIQAYGQDVIMVKMTRGVKAVLSALKTLLDRDPYCEEFIGAYRAGELDFYNQEYFNHLGNKDERL